MREFIEHARTLDPADFTFLPQPDREEIAA